MDASVNGAGPPAPSWPDPMRAEAFVGLPGAFVEMVEDHTEADRHGLLLQLLAAAGNAIGRGPGVMADGAFHPTNVWPVLIGESSKARKGTSWSRVRGAMELADPEWAANCIEGGLSSGEGLVHHVRDEVRGRRKAKKGELGDDDGMIDDVLDAGVEDKRLLVVETEWAQVFKVMAREGNTLSIALRRLWDFGEAGALTKRDRTKVTGGHVTVIGHGTVDELRAVISEVDVAGGLVNRHLFCCVKRSKLLPEGGSIPGDGLERYARELGSALTTAAHMKTLFVRSDAARALWRKEYLRLVAEVPGLLGTATSRAEAQVLRLSLIFAMLDERTFIEVEHLRAALAVWDYCAASAAYLFGHSTGDDVADRILSGLRRARNGMTRTEIRELVGNKLTEARIGHACDLLKRHALANATEARTGGRPAQRWRATRTHA